MSALPEYPTERDRERFRDITKAMRFGLEYDRRLATNGDYTDQQTVAMFRLWWSVERERQLLQNLNQSQGCKISELLGRSEDAESELEAIREDNHSMMLEIHNLRIERDALVAELAKLREQKPVAFWWIGEGGENHGGPYRGMASEFSIDNARNSGCSPQYLYAAPVPAVAAPSVPEEWREVMAELAADLQAACDAEHPHRDQYPSVMRKYNNDMEIVEKARALLQSADHSERNFEKAAPDCRTCANRGQVNGLSQESYCDSCVYQGRDCRQNHFVDVSEMVDDSKRRCEACAILPCSCK